MYIPNNSFKSGDEGKGAIGCIFALLLMVIALFLAIKLGPPYMSHYEFKGEFKQAVSRVAARGMVEENIIKEMIATAEKNKIVLKSENIQIRRFAGQLIITVEYTIPVDFIFMERELRFKLEESSWTAT